MKTYILGLEHDFRGEELKSELERFGFQTEVVFGVDGANMSKSDLSKVYSKSRSRVFSNRELSASEVGCSLGHLDIYKRIVKNGDAWNLVMEDDTKLLEPKILQALNLRIIDNPLIVQLQGLIGLQKNSLASHDASARSYRCLITKSENISSSLEEEFRIFYYKGISEGTYAYLINKAAAEIAVLHSKKVDSTADWPYRWREKTSFAVSLLSVCVADISDSNIASEREKLVQQDSLRSRRQLWNQHYLFKLRTLLGLLGIPSFFAFLQGHSYSQHYKENYLYPFVVRRLNSDK